MIIDFHTHIFPDKIAERTIGALSSSSSSKPHTNGKETGLIEAMVPSGVTLSVNLPVVTKPAQIESVIRFGTELNEKYSEKVKNILSAKSEESGSTLSSKGDAFKSALTANNDERSSPLYSKSDESSSPLSSNNKENSSPISPAILSFAGIHPEDDQAEEHLELIKKQGFRGIKIHPDYQGTFFDDEKYVRILRLAKELDLITVTHAGVDGAFLGQPIKCTPSRVLRVLDKLGGYEKLVLAHLGGGKMEKEVIENLAGENVYFDTAYLLTLVAKADISAILERHSIDKILFATDSPWSEAQRDLAVISSLGLSKENEEKILFKNALSLLA